MWIELRMLLACFSLFSLAGCSTVPPKGAPSGVRYADLREGVAVVWDEPVWSSIEEGPADEESARRALSEQLAQAFVSGLTTMRKDMPVRILSPQERTNTLSGVRYVLHVRWMASRSGEDSREEFVAVQVPEKIQKNKRGDETRTPPTTETYRLWTYLHWRNAELEVRLVDLRGATRDWNKHIVGTYTNSKQFRQKETENPFVSRTTPRVRKGESLSPARPGLQQAAMAAGQQLRDTLPSACEDGWWACMKQAW